MFALLRKLFTRPDACRCPGLGGYRMLDGRCSKCGKIGGAR
jgi:hypothetical protein